MGVFLSYRHADSAHALWLYPWLIQWFGKEKVFWDRKGIDPGKDFAEVIETQIRSSKAFVALVSNKWLSAVDEKGHRRIDSPEDWIRRETALALKEKLLMIPVLVGGMMPPSPTDLPRGLKKFAKLQMLSMADMSFHDLLRESLEKVVPAGVQKPGSTDKETERLQRRAGTLLQRQIDRLQIRAKELIQDRKLDRATEELNEGSALLMALLELSPGDITLDAQLGYLFGAMGQAFFTAGDEEQAGRYRDLAMSVFQRVKANPAVFHDRPLDLVSAIKGIGEMYYESGDAVTAIQYYRTALEIYPLYAYAWHDLFLAYDNLARRRAINLAGMREAIDKARETGAGQPGLGDDKFEALESLFRGWREQVVLHPPREIADGIVRVVPQFLWLIIGESDSGLAVFNLNCEIVHHFSPRVIIRKLDAELTTPKGHKQRFKWNIFYDLPPAGTRVVKVSDAHEIEIEAGSKFLGIQFVSPVVKRRLLWARGKYKLELFGWMSKESGDDQFETKTSFAFDINDDEADQVKYWIRAKKTEWDKLNDPDRSIGIQVEIRVDELQESLGKAGRKWTTFQPSSFS
jgi:tetratricopeptide (TPR) repeat protein